MTKLTPTVLIALIAAACSSTDDRSARTVDSDLAERGLITLDDRESQLATSFDKNSERAQLLVVLSPT